MSVSKRIYLIVALIALSALSISAIGITKMVQVGNELEEIAHEDIPLTEKVTMITLHQLEQAILLERALRAASVTAGADFERDRKAFEKLAHKVDEEIKEGEELAQHSVDHAINEEARKEFQHVLDLLKKIEKEHLEYEHHAFEILEAAAAGKASEVTDLVIQTEKEQEKLDHELEDLLIELEKFTHESAEHALQEEKQGIQLMIIATIVSILLGLGIGILIGRNISGGVKSITNSMTDLAGGDLEAEIPGLDRKDEIGAMAKAVQVFKENAIRVAKLEEEQAEARQQARAERQKSLTEMAETVERETKKAVDSVAGKASGMKEAASKMRQSSELVSGNSQSVAAAAQESLQNSQTVASAGEELSASITEIMRQVEGQTKIAGEAVAKAEPTVQAVNELSAAAASIGEVVTFIQDIAEQTNLLALNATIEAARAGDMGKGFAVVANEVKNLASQTAKATEDIDTQVSSMQSKTTHCAEAIKGITGTIHEMNEISAGIANAVKEQNSATSEISQNVTESTNAATEVTTQIAQVSQESANSSEYALEVTDYADKVAIEVEELQTILNRIVRTAHEDVDRRKEDRPVTNDRRKTGSGGSEMVQDPPEILNAAD